ncbi:MAG: hypothetical protein ACTHQM_13250 [Thermoanaerobaculia bacterium]
MSDWQRTKRTALILGIAGIAIEVITVLLLSQHRIHAKIATPIIIGGMLLAFIPMFVVARHSRRR